MENKQIMNGCVTLQVSTLETMS